MVWVHHAFVWVADLTDIFLGRVVILPGFSADRSDWLSGVVHMLTHFSCSVYELRRSSSLLTPSAVALGESHSLTLYDPGGVASVTRRDSVKSV